MAACGFSIRSDPRAVGAMQQEVFWRRLAQLCGRAYEGRMAEGTDSTFVRHRLVMRVRDCSAAEVRIGFVIGPDSSRTWIVRRVRGGLALTHDVREGLVTGYGGVTRTAGTAERQDFAADSATARMLPPAANNVWSLEILDGQTFAYTVARPGVRQRFRLEFDLRRPVSQGKCPVPGARFVSAARWAWETWAALRSYDTQPEAPGEVGCSGRGSRSPRRRTS